ncbi:MAG: hypothetical protein SGPRY_014142 [Prymnesium sp.]
MPICLSRWTAHSARVSWINSRGVPLRPERRIRLKREGGRMAELHTLLHVAKELVCEDSLGCRSGSVSS